MAAQGLGQVGARGLPRAPRRRFSPPSAKSSDAIFFILGPRPRLGGARCPVEFESGLTGRYFGGGGNVGFRRFPHGEGEKRAGIILDGPIVEKLRFLRMGIWCSG